MTANTHALGGAAAALLACRLGVPCQAWPAAAAVGAFGGLLPDIDHPSSYLGRRVPLFSDGVNLVFGHRGATHSLLAACLFFVAAFLLACRWVPTAAAWSFAAYLLAGYLSHLFLDMLNPQPVPLLWPLGYRARFPLPPVFGTGGPGEAYVVRPLVAAVAAYLCYLHLPVPQAAPSGVEAGPLAETASRALGQMLQDLRKVLKFFIGLFVKVGTS